MLNTVRDWLSSITGNWAPSTLKTITGMVSTVLVVWLISLIAMKAVDSSLQRVFGKERRYVSDRRAKTLVPLLRSLARYIVYFLAGLTVLSKLGVPVASLLAAAGIGGLAIGFGAQSLVRDVITGFFLLFEDQFAVGDHVALAGISGVVEEMTLRVTRVRDFGGQLHIIPNGQIQQVTNFMGAKMRVLVDIKVPSDTNVHAMESILDGCFQEFRANPSVKDGPLLLGLTHVDGTGLTYQVLARTEPGQQGEIERRMLAAIWEALGTQGIRPPAPVHEVLLSSHSEAAGERDVRADEAERR